MTGEGGHAGSGDECEGREADLLAIGGGQRLGLGGALGTGLQLDG